LAKLEHRAVLGAGAVPVLVLGAAQTRHPLNDHVFHPDLDRAPASGAAVKLLGDGPDQPYLVAVG
jgi:hypothetical protein